MDSIPAVATVHTLGGIQAVTKVQRLALSKMSISSHVEELGAAGGAQRPHTGAAGGR